MISEYQRYEFVVAPPFEFVHLSEPFCFIDLLMQAIFLIRKVVFIIRGLLGST